MNKRVSQGNLKIRENVIEPIVLKITSDSQFKQLILRTYNIAQDKSQIESPEVPLCKIIQDLLPSEFKNLDLTHDEILQIVVCAKLGNAIESGGSIILSPEFFFGDPSQSEYWVEKGKMILENKFINNSIRCFNKALSIDANNVEALYRKGWCIFRLATIGSEAANSIWIDLSNLRKMLEEALLCFEKIIKSNRKHAQAWYGKGACLVEIGRPTGDLCKVREAMNCFKRSLSIDPTNEHVKEALRVCEENLQ